MKNISKVITTVLLGYILLVGASNLQAQGPVPPDPTFGGTNGAVNHPSGADISSANWFLLILGGLYVGYKIYQGKKNTVLVRE